MEDHHHHRAAETDPAAMAELLDLDAEVLHSYLSEVTGWVRELAAGMPRRRIIDLGSGTGAGALALVKCFEEADVIAVDMSAPLLERLSAKARELGVTDRVRTLQADLDAAWPATGPADLVWASSSLHHMADPDRVLADVFATLRPGGLMALVELDSFPRFLSDDADAALEERCHAGLDQHRASELPHLGSDWGPHLSAAGFTVEAKRHFAIDLVPPLPAAAGRYAQATLRRMRSGLDGQLSADDLAALDTLIDSEGPDGVLRRQDLTVRAARDAWVARRP